MIRFQVEDRSGKRRTVEVPEKINLNLMEVLKAWEYDVKAACGGMALCATCHVEIAEGIEQLSERTDAELDMLDRLPSSQENSRLACQIKVDHRLEGSIIRLAEENC